MSRMRKQDEMENLRRENDRLKVDNQDLEDELTRLRDELSSRGIAPATQPFRPSIKTELERPLTPPESSALDKLASPQSVPSLTHTSSPSAPSLDLDHNPDPAKSLFADAQNVFGPLPLDTPGLKPSDDSRSAETCSHPWGRACRC